MKTIILFLIISVCGDARCALAQFSSVPGTKLVILRMDPPLPDRSIVETALRTFASRDHFTEGLPMGKSSVAFGRDPDLSLIGTFDRRYIDVVLWTDPDDHQPYRSEIKDLVDTLRPLGFRELSALPDDPD